MSKLSRKDKYRDLRQSIEEQTEKAQTPGRPSRLSRMAAPDAKAEARKEILPEPNPVMEDLIGEVRQYNINKGELVEEDTQLQILHDLSAKEQADARRSEHFEVMEPNDDAGGTTRNLFGSDLSSVLAASAKTQPASSAAAKPAEPADMKSGQPEEEDQEDQDYLDLFTPGSANETVVEESGEAIEDVPQKSARAKASFFGRSKKNAGNAETRRSKEEPEDTLDSLFETAEIFTPDLSDQELLESVDSEDDDQDYFEEKPVRFLRKANRSQENEGDEAQDEAQTPPASRAAMIFMVICCIVLVILIVLTIYWMSKLGIF